MMCCSLYESFQCKLKVLVFQFQRLFLCKDGVAGFILYLEAVFIVFRRANQPRRRKHLITVPDSHVRRQCLAEVVWLGRVFS